MVNSAGSSSAAAAAAAAAQRAIAEQERRQALLAAQRAQQAAQKAQLAALKLQTAQRAFQSRRASDRFDAPKLAQINHLQSRASTLQVQALQARQVALEKTSAMIGAQQSANAAAVAAGTPAPFVPTPLSGVSSYDANPYYGRSPMTSMYGWQTQHGRQVDFSLNNGPDGKPSSKTTTDPNTQIDNTHNVQVWQGPQFNHSASLWELGGGFGDPNSPTGISGDGQFQVLNAQANAGVGASFDPTRGAASLTGQAGAAANLFNAQGQATAQYSLGGIPSSTQFQADASVGANAQVQGNATFDPLHGDAGVGVQGTAFAGVQAGGTITQTIGPVSGSVTGQVEAGVGAQFQANAGLDHGKIQFAFDGGASLGVGANFGVNFSVDPAALIKDGQALVNALESGGAQAGAPAFRETGRF